MSERTTLTLDDDVAAGLKREVARSGRAFRTVVNDALRTGLAGQRQRQPTPFRVEAADLGLREALALDSISALLEQVEGPDHR